MTGPKYPCGSGAKFDACCGPILSGTPAPTAEALMRSRYTAFVRGDVDYITRSYAPKHRASIGNDLPAVDWVGLEIIGTTGGGIDDDIGTVDFAARYKTGGAVRIHRENSNFRREDGHWVYIDGEIAPNTPAEKTGKTGRNAPCPCGSGKKFKKCCGG